MEAKKLKEFDLAAEKWEKSHDNFIQIIFKVSQITPIIARLNQIIAISGIDRLRKTALVNQCRIEMTWMLYE